MPTTLTSPNMNIVVPVASTQIGPTWAQNLQAALYTTVDGHDHSSGKGLQVTPLGLNINADLPFGSFNATALRSSRYTQQSAALAIGSDVGCLYAVTGTVSSVSYNGDAFWNNGAGTAIPITRGGALAVPAASGSTFVETIRTITANYTVDSGGADFEIWLNASGAITVTLPTPTIGRVIILADITGALETNNVTLAQHAAEKINGFAGSRTLQTNWGRWTIVSDGTNWVVQGSGRETKKVITGTGTFTPQSGVTEYKVIGWGGGGSGGSGASGSPASGGGGGGAALPSIAYVTVTPNAAITVTIGAGGASVAGTAGAGTVGNVGADSTFGTYATFGGASGGAGGTTAATTAAGGGLATKGAAGTNLYTAIGAGTLAATGTGVVYSPGCGGHTWSQAAAAAAFAGSMNIQGGFSGGAAGTPSSGIGGGGGGAAGPGAAGGGGGNSAGGAGTAAAANSGAGGGGGGGISSSTSGASGAGGSGQITVVWVD